MLLFFTSIQTKHFKNILKQITTHPNVQKIPINQNIIAFNQNQSNTSKSKKNQNENQNNIKIYINNNNNINNNTIKSKSNPLQTESNKFYAIKLKQNALNHTILIIKASRSVRGEQLLGTLSEALI